MSSVPAACDVAIVGAGAAGLATAIFLKRASPGVHVVLLEGASRPGAKILVSGGGRCNVTNTVVRESDFWGGRRTVVRRVLRAMPAGETVAFFRDLGVPLHEEPGGKLFPDSNRSRDVLEALLRAAGGAGVDLQGATRVLAVRRDDDRFSVETSRGALNATALVLATGGRSLPKSGSDGAGYEFARDLGHSLVATTPALAPLVLDGATGHAIHAELSGVAIDGEIAVWVDGAVATRLSGALLWTHFGVSGPLALNASRHWARARIEGRGVHLTLNMRPGKSFEQVDATWTAAVSARPRATVRSTIAADLPDAVALAVLKALELAPDLPLADLTRADRRRIVHALTAWPLPVADTRGYNFAEVTAGGVDLAEIDPATMESRVCPRLFLVGEILDVDGRIGGFNFQWAWSGAAAAAAALARMSGGGTTGPGSERR
jgi:predicted Rossmann fold flavoprotein